MARIKKKGNIAFISDKKISSNISKQVPLARPRTSSRELKQSASSRSVSRIFASSASGKESILASHAIRRRHRVHRARRPHFIIRRTSNTCFTSRFSRNSANKRLSRRRSQRRSAEAMHTTLPDSSVMPRDRRRLERQSTPWITSLQSVIQRLSML